MFIINPDLKMIERCIMCGCILDVEKEHKCITSKGWDNKKITKVGK